MAKTKTAAKRKTDLDDLIGKPKKVQPAQTKGNSRSPRVKPKKADDLDDLIGTPKGVMKSKKGGRAVKKVAEDLSDLIGTPRPRKPADIEVGEVSYNPLVRPKNPHPDGLWAKREQKGKNWGVTCLNCNEPLKWIGGRPPVVCKKKPCFRAYRNLYRRDYEKHAAAVRKKAGAA